MDHKLEIEELVERNAKLERRIELVNAKLLKSEELKSDFLSNIKNEINNPMTSILGLLNQIVLSPDDAKRTATNAGLIYTEMYALNFQIRNIFNAAEIEAGQSFPELSNVNVRALIEELAYSFRHLAEKKNITFDLVLNADDSFVSDHEKLEVVLANLISNAIKFSNENSTIIVKTFNEDAKLHINVQDFGVGIETKNLGQIYDRFRQLDTGTRKEFGGHGLGLSIVHSLISILEGSLDMKSKFEEGTLFEIELPVRTAEEDGLQEDEIFFTSNNEEGEVF
ncbi:MAG: HAMP domain-containing sensor histidine kinase [Cyclobacteriaceae bacterium]